MSINGLDGAADEMEHAIAHGTRAEIGVALKELREVHEDVRKEFNEVCEESADFEAKYLEYSGEVETLRAENEMLRSALDKLVTPLAREAILQGVDLTTAQRCFPLS
jgi:hypothetical protein